MVSDRKLDGLYSGSIIVNGRERSPHFRKHTAYVLQKTLSLASLTVEETIYYSVWTRVASLRTKKERQNRVEELLKLLKLEEVRGTLVGNELVKGISGGQLKRLSIAVELAHLPDVIFLDEPTSGLDSSMSLEVMSAVKQAIGTHRLCVSTIHSPSPDTFALFDQLVLLAAGRVVYAGRMADALPYFTSKALDYCHFADENPAEFVIAISSGRLAPQSQAAPRSPAALETLFRQHLADAPRQSTDADAPGTGTALSVKYHDDVAETSTWTQLQMLLHRTFTARIRDTADLRAHAMKNAIVGLLVGVLFYNQAHIVPPFFVGQAISPQVTGVNAMLFLTIMFSAVSNIQSVPMLCDQSLLYRQEVAARAYGPVPYWLASLVVPLPFLLAFHFVFFCTVFYLVGFPRNTEFFFAFTGIVFTTNVVVFAMGFVLATVTGSAQVAIALYPISFVVLVQFAGFLINLRSIPPGWIWGPYVSFARWALQGLMVAHWSLYGRAGRAVIAAFAFDGLLPSTCAWILFAFIGGFAAVSLWKLLPPRKRLEHLTPEALAASSKGHDDRDAAVAHALSPADSPAALGDEPLALEMVALEDGRATGAGTARPQSYAPVQQGPSDAVGGDAALADEDAAQAEPCHVTFRRVTYEVADRARRGRSVTLLDGVSGDVAPGEMCALMGASGAGKSTLLDVLAGRKTTGRVAGVIRYNAARAPVALAYVLQDNVHLGLLTVRETIHFAALLRLPETWPDAAKRRRVSTIIDMLQLRDVADSRVGDEARRGISGGQLKRLSIAVEIVHLPALLFFDEPTTGLDSATSFEVMSAVRALANAQHAVAARRRTVLATIHQPSRRCFALFDKLLLLFRGRVIFFGAAVDAVAFFAASPLRLAGDASVNPAEWLMDVAGGKARDPLGAPVDGQQLVALFDASCAAAAAAAAADSAPVDAPTDDAPRDVSATSQRACVTSVRNQVAVLLRRGFVVLSRDSVATVFALVRHVVVSVFFGSIYLHLSTGSGFAAYTNRMGVLYFNTVFFIVSNLQALPAMLDQRLLFYRERGARAYGTFAYWMSVWLLQVPVMATNVLVYAAILYHMVGLRPGASHFFFFYYVLLLMSLWSVQLAGFIASIAESTQAALSYFPIVMFVNVGFAGYLIFLPRFPAWLGNWGPYVSIMRFAFQSLVLNEFEGNAALPEAGVYLANMGFAQLSKTATALLLLPFYAFFNVAFLGALHLVNFEKR